MFYTTAPANPTYSHVSHTYTHTHKRVVENLKLSEMFAYISDAFDILLLTITINLTIIIFIGLPAVESGSFYCFNNYCTE